MHVTESWVKNCLPPSAGPLALKLILLTQIYADKSGTLPAHPAWIRAHPLKGIPCTDAEVIAAVGEMESAGLIDLREIPHDSPQETEICITFRYGKTCFKTTQVSDEREIVQPAKSSDKIRPVRTVSAPEPAAEPTRSAPQVIDPQVIDPQVIASREPDPESPPDDPDHDDIDDLGEDPFADFGPQPSETDPV